jgi:hypothetical protein
MPAGLACCWQLVSPHEQRQLEFQVREKGSNARSSGV